MRTRNAVVNVDGIVSNFDAKVSCFVPTSEEKKDFGLNV
jgi:hypothetical protein